MIKEALTDQLLSRSVFEAAIESTFLLCLWAGAHSLSSCVPEEKSQVGMEKPCIPGIFWNLEGHQEEIRLI